MKLVICKEKGDSIVGVAKDFRGMTDGEVRHFIAELEVAKLQLLKKLLD